VASEVSTLPRRGDLVRFADGGMAYEVAQIEHIATDHSRSGLRHTTILMRLSAAAHA
jgi:hypothetical protein